MSTSLKDLQQTLADGAEGFTKAAETVSNPELKVLFEAFAAERREMADELAAFSSADPEDETPSVAGALHRGWINLKSVLTSGDDHAILAECERGEDHAVAVFQKAASETGEAQATIGSISMRILAVHNQVKELRDAAQS